VSRQPGPCRPRPAIRRPVIPRPRTLGVVSAVTLLFAAGCAGELSTLDPAGPRAADIATIGWLMTAMALLVQLLVVALVIHAVLRHRRGPAPPSRLGPNPLIVSGGIILPLIMLPIVWAVTIADMADKAEPPSDPVATVQVTAYQFYYEFACEGADHEATINEVHIPVGEPVRFEVTSADVIHSFWVPRLAGKIDILPGATNEIWIVADEPGVYLGQCAEFCGEFHADMRFSLVVGDAGECATGAAAGGGCCA
jgi:cytochrome c oxidase subunit II